MNKKVKITIVLLCCIILGISGCGNVNDVGDISKQIGVDIESGTVIESYDDHGGFHGDGTSVTQVKIEDEDFEQKLKNSEDWSNSISKVLQALLYGYEENDCGYGPFIIDDEDNPLFPTFENAYYYIEDRQDNGYDLEGLDLLDNPSINVTIAVYDMDSGTLYYCEYDT